MPSDKDLRRDEIRPENVLEALREHAPRSLHVAEIAGRIGSSKKHSDKVRDVLDRLVDLGLVREMPGGRFRLTPVKLPPRTVRADSEDVGTERKSNANERSNRTARPHAPNQRSQGRAQGQTRGRITVHPRGYGFVAAEDGGPDVFIPPDAMGAALHGDLVEVDARKSAKGRDGSVLSVIERNVRRITGTIRRLGRAYVLEPDDLRLRGPMPLVEDPPKNIPNGAVVIADIVRYPTSIREMPQVAAMRLLGASGVVEVEVTKIKLREGVVENFPDDVHREADHLPTSVPAEEHRKREDLRGFDLVTIDPEDARDHDDAVWAERIKNGGFRVLVAIADVSHYVQEGTAIDREAFARGCSVYLPDRAIPMLPPELSSRMASLLPNEDRLCIAIEVELQPNGAIRRKRYIEGLMRSGARLSYGGVARALGITDQVAVQPEAEKRIAMLQVLAEAALALRKRRMQRGSLDFDLPEPRVVLNEKGEPTDVYRSKKDPGVRQAYQMIEEMMLLANEVVAADMSTRRIPTMYRVHGPPDEEKLALFAALASSLGYSLDPDAATQPKKLAAFLRRIAGTPKAHALNFLLLRSMQQATYNITNIGHFGLGAKDYLHFTSPIRRYPDLVVHRVLRRVLRKERVDEDAAREKLRAQAIESSRLERRAESVERDVVDLYRALLVQPRIGEEFDATITGLAEHGFYVTFDAPFVDALVPIELLRDDVFELDDLGLRFSGRDTGVVYALGNRIRIRLEDVNLSRRQLIALPNDQPAMERAPKLERSDRTRKGPRHEDTKRQTKGRKQQNERSGRNTPKPQRNQSGERRPSKGRKRRER